MFDRKHHQEPVNQSEARPVSTSFSLISGVVSSVLTVPAFHPFYVGMTRNQTHAMLIRSQNQPKTLESGYAHLHRVIFNGLPLGAGWCKHIKSLYAGAAMAYVSRAISGFIQMGGTPILTRELNYVWRAELERQVGHHWVSPILNSVAASFTGGLQAMVCSPLETITTQLQTHTHNPRSMITMVREDGLRLYRGSLFSVGRSSLTSATLFGFSALVEEKFRKENGTGKLEYWQKWFANAMASVASCVVGNPFEVVRSRIQADTTGLSSREIILNLLQQEGISALFKNLLARLLIIGPRLGAVKFLSEVIEEYLSTTFKQIESDTISAVQIEGRIEEALVLDEPLHLESPTTLIVEAPRNIRIGPR